MLPVQEPFVKADLAARVLTTDRATKDIIKVARVQDITKEKIGILVSSYEEGW